MAAVIEDDGRGFDPTTTRDGGSACSGMRERVALLDGRLEVESSPGAAARRSSAEVPVRVTIRVLIVDDHAVVRSGLRLLLEAEDDIEIVGEAGDVREAVFEAREHEARRRPHGRRHARAAAGIEATPQVLQEAPGREGARALDAGRPALRARGVRRRRERLRAQGGGGHGGRRGDPRGRRRRPLRPPGARRAAGRGRRRSERAQAEADPLSDREREVLRLLALGHTNQEIAKMLYISVRTAETHRAHIMQKLRLATPRRARALRDRHRAARGSARIGAFGVPVARSSYSKPSG